MPANPAPSHTSSNRPKRRYRLSPTGRESLRKSASRNQPWSKSTGPRSASGKERAKMNALQHGARSAEAAARRKTIRHLLGFLRRPEVLAGAPTPIPMDPYTGAHLEQLRRFLR